MQSDLYSQINGISGSKLCIPHASTLEKGSFEFEQSISVFNASHVFNSEGDINPIAGTTTQSDMAFRITLGVSDYFELGTAFLSGMDEIFVGTKFRIFNQDYLGIALLTGMSIPAGNHDAAEQKAYGSYSYSIGTALTKDFTKKFSSDLCFAYTKFSSSGEFSYAFNYGISFGYYLLDNFQFATEFIGINSFSEEINSGKLSIAPGFTYDFSNNLGLAAGIQKDIFGKNELDGLGFFSVFTMNF